MNSNSRSVYLSPGEYFVGGAGCEVRTLLGSCVSITLWNRARRVGAMSHFMLAQRHPGRLQGISDALDARYGPEALALMLRDLAVRGVAGGDCEAKLFGGGSMFPDHDQGPDGAPLVGRSNGDAAVALLRAHGIPVVSYSLFGTGHRKLVFDIASGDVWAHREEHDTDTRPHDLAEFAAPSAMRRQAR